MANQNDANDQQQQNKNPQASFFGFYNSMSSMTSSIKKNIAAAANKAPFRKPEGEKSEGGDSASSSVSGTPSHEPQPAPEPIQEPDIPELPPEPALPPGVLFQVDGHINFKILTEDYLEKAIILLSNNFFKDEPFGKALYVETPNEADHWLTKSIPHMIRHEVSIMAIDESEEGKGNLVGVSINTVKLKGQPRGPDDILTWIDPKKEPKMHKIVSFMHQVSSGVDFYNNYEVEKLFSFDMLNVNKMYGGRGIAAMLVEQSISVAKEKDFKCLVAETTGIFTAKIFARNGFKAIREVPYSSQRENGKLMFPATGIHTSVRVSVKILPIGETLKK